MREKDEYDPGTVAEKCGALIPERGFTIHSQALNVSRETFFR
jgi:hypothetical protein